MTYSDEVLADAPAIYWRLNEPATGSITTATDSSGHGRHGTYSVYYLQGQPGLLDSEPETTSAYVQGSAGSRIASTYAAAVTSFSLEAWVRPATDGLFIGRDSTTSSQRMFRLGMPPQFWIQKPVGTFQNIGSPAGMVLGDVYHVVGTYDGTTMRLYVNGLEVISGTSVSGPIANTAAVFSAAGAASPGVEFTGNIQEVAYYETALPAARVSAHYMAGKGPTTVRVWNGTAWV